jgi:hypothetical protein
MVLNLQNVLVKLVGIDVKKVLDSAVTGVKNVCA